MEKRIDNSPTYLSGVKHGQKSCLHAILFVCLMDLLTK